MKKISVVIPCYNDGNGIAQLQERIIKVFEKDLPQYDYELIYIDDCSPDEEKTWYEIGKVCKSDPKCKGIRNTQNFGAVRNSFSALTYGSGDATFLLFGDLQDPPEYLPQFIKYWEDGYMVVVGARKNSYTNLLLHWLRKIYYEFMEKITNRRVLHGVNFYGLYDKSFIEVMAQIDDIQPAINGIITEYASNVKIVDVIQEKSAREKSNINFWGRYDFAMINLTAYSKIVLRLATLIGAIIGFMSVLFSILVFFVKLFSWDNYSVGIPALTCGVFFLGGIQLFFLGIIGEYVLSINNRSIKRPITTVEQRINFEE